MDTVISMTFFPTNAPSWNEVPQCSVRNLISLRGILKHGIHPASWQTSHPAAVAGYQPTWWRAGQQASSSHSSTMSSRCWAWQNSPPSLANAIQVQPEAGAEWWECRGWSFTADGRSWWGSTHCDEKWGDSSLSGHRRRWQLRDVDTPLMMLLLLVWSWLTKAR